MKSIDITSHLHSGMGNQFSNLAGCWCLTFTSLHSKHFVKYSATSLFIPHQNTFFLNEVIIFWYTGCPTYGFVWFSSNIICFTWPNWECKICFGRLIIFQNFQHIVEFLFVVISVESPDIQDLIAMNFLFVLWKFY